MKRELEEKLPSAPAKRAERHPATALLTVLVSTAAYLIVLLAISAFVNFAFS